MPHFSPSAGESYPPLTNRLIIIHLPRKNCGAGKSIARSGFSHRPMRKSACTTAGPSSPSAPDADTGATAAGAAPTASSGTDVAVSTSALSRRFGDLVAVNNVSLSVLPGEIFGLIGSNGAGKSTLIKMLTTLLPPSSGGARVAGFDIIAEAGQVRRSIGYVPQMLSADGALTGYENLLLSARLYVIPRRERADRIAEALAMMNLS